MPSGILSRGEARVLHPRWRRQRKLPPDNEKAAAQKKQAAEAAFASDNVMRSYAAGALVAAVLAGLAAYFWRNFSTRPAVSTIFCLPV